MDSFSKVSATQTSCRAYGQSRQRWLHGSLPRQASIKMPLTVAEETTSQQKQNVESDLHAEQVELELDLHDYHFNSPSTFNVPSYPANLMPTTTNGLIPPALFVSPLFSPLTPTMTPRSPFLEKHSIGYRYKGVQTAGHPAASSRLRPGLLDLSVSLCYPASPHFPRSATQEAIPSPFRTQLQEDVATTPLPSTPLTARWPGSTICIQRSALMLEV